MEDGDKVTVVDPLRGSLVQTTVVHSAVGLTPYAHVPFGGSMLLQANEEGISWVRGWGDDITAALLLARSAT